MAHGKRKTKLIEVKAAPMSNTTAVNLVKLSKKSKKNACKMDIETDLMKMTTGSEKTVDSSAPATSESAEDFVTAMRQIPASQDIVMEEIGDDYIEIPTEETQSEKIPVNVHVSKEVNAKGEEAETPGNLRKVNEDDLIDVHKKTTGMNEPKLEITCGDVAYEAKDEIKKKRKKKKGKNKKQKMRTNENQTTEEELDNKRPARLPPIEKSVKVKDEKSNIKERALKTPGCFGFISTWWVKRKERRREKKRKAIDARKTNSVESLVVYENRKARGGVAFTIQVENRPIMKPVLPPIRPTARPNQMSTKQKLEIAEVKRCEHINRKRDVARTQSRLVREVVNKREQKENEFKKATLEKIKLKEDRATSRLQVIREQRCRTRCASRIESQRSPHLSTPELESPLDIFDSKIESNLSDPSTPRWDDATPLTPVSDKFDPFWDLPMGLNYNNN